LIETLAESLGFLSRASYELLIAIERVTFIDTVYVDKYYVSLPFPNPLPES